MTNSERIKFSKESEPKFLVNLAHKHKSKSHFCSKFPLKQSCAWVPLKILLAKLKYHHCWCCYSIPKYSCCAEEAVCYCGTTGVGSVALEENTEKTSRKIPFYFVLCLDQPPELPLAWWFQGGRISFWWLLDKIIWNYIQTFPAHQLRKTMTFLPLPSKTKVTHTAEGL